MRTRRIFFLVLLGLALCSSGAFWFKWPVDWLVEHDHRTLVSGSLSVNQGDTTKITSTYGIHEIFISGGPRTAALAKFTVVFKDADNAVIDTFTTKTYADAYMNTPIVCGEMASNVYTIVIRQTTTNGRYWYHALVDNE